MTPARAPVRSTATLRDALSLLAEQGAMVLAVVDARNCFAGVLTRAQIDGVLQSEASSTRVARLLPGRLGPLTPDQSVDDALEQLADGGVPWLPVVSDGRLVGGLAVRDAVRTYKTTLQRSARRTQGLPEGTSVFEVQLREGSPIVGRPLSQAGLPRQILVASVRRDGETIFPSASTRLQTGDVLTVLADPTHEEALRHFFDATPETH